MNDRLIGEIKRWTPGNGNGMAHRDNPASDAGNNPPANLLRPAEWKRVVEALGLSPQEARVVALILHGRRDKQIAADLGLSVPTVRTYLTRIFAHTGTADRVELILRVFQIVRRKAKREDLRHQD